MKSTARAPRGQYVKTAARRQEIVKAALEVYSGSGFRDGSLREVADKVGISQAGLLHHYPSKSHLLKAVLEWRDEDAGRRMGDPLPKGTDLLRAMIDLAEYNASTPKLVQLHVVLSAEATAPNHPVHDYFVHGYARLVDNLRHAFEEIAQRGELVPGVDPGSAARTLVALLDGLQVQWLLDRSSVDMAVDLRRFLDGLLTIELESSRLAPGSRERARARKQKVTAPTT